MKRTRRHLKRRTVIVAIGALVAVGVFAATLSLWPRPGGHAGTGGVLHVDPGPKATGPVTITGVDANLVWTSTPTVPVTISVRNTSGRSADTEVWWILGQPGDPKPWLDAAVQALPIAADLSPGEKRSVLVVPPSQRVKPGYYDLSLWAHTRSGKSSSWVHSDGRALLGQIEVVSPEHGITHVGGTSPSLWLHSAQPSGTWSPNHPAAVSVQIANATSSGSIVQVWWYLSKTDDKKPWNDRSAVQSSIVTVDASPAGLTTVDVSMPRLPQPGSYHLSAWLHQLVGTDSVSRDGVLVKEPVLLVGNGH